METIKAVMEGILEEKEREFEERRQTREYDLERLILSNTTEMLTPVALRDRFESHQRRPGTLWSDLVFDLRSYLENWLSGMEIKDLKELKDLLVTEQLKKKELPLSFPTQEGGTEPTIEFPAFVEKNEGDTAQLKNSDFSSEQNKCKDQHVLGERTKWGVSECCRKKEGNLERVGTKRGEEFRLLGVPLKFTLEINQLSHPLSDTLGRVQGILKLALKALCEEKGEKRILSALFTLHTVSHKNRGFSPSKCAMTRYFMTLQNLIYEWRIVGEKLTQDKGCEKAFVELRGNLVSKPILFTPDFSTDFILQTDASDIGAGVVLSQKINGEEHPIIYLIKEFSNAERNYSTVERELAAIIFGLKRLEHYLDGQRFIIETDHNPLKYLRKMGDSNPRLQRWALSLQPFNF
ncbi:retrovirus-related Pol polyprotein from transposon 17.6 [Trichonephila clavipes]|nr:retrovirus-related Pol polyprotein from transposon 17.6 [Trichonephila clavipes]